MCPRHPKDRNPTTETWIFFIDFLEKNRQSNYSVQDKADEIWGSAQLHAWLASPDRAQASGLVAITTFGFIRKTIHIESIFQSIKHISIVIIINTDV